MFGDRSDAMVVEVAPPTEDGNWTGEVALEDEGMLRYLVLLARYYEYPIWNADPEGMWPRPVFVWRVKMSDVLHETLLTRDMLWGTTWAEVYTSLEHAAKDMKEYWPIRLPDLRKTSRSGSRSDRDLA